MTWIANRVTFRLLSPMHIGWRKLGNLQQTRPYVTGRSLWGALTARLTREHRSKDYEGMGKKVDEQLAFTYFYPSTSKDTDAVELWPWEDDWDKFAWAFLGSYASTALENGRSAEAGSLHETEFIAPYTRDEEPVYLVGYIFEREDCQLDWQSALNKLQLGGERSYGWGRVGLEKPYDEIKDNICFGYELDCNGDHPKIKVLKDRELLAHTDAENVDGTGTMSHFLAERLKTALDLGKASLSTKYVGCRVVRFRRKKPFKFWIREYGNDNHKFYAMFLSNLDINSKASRRKRLFCDYANGRARQLAIIPPSTIHP